jgi:AsmA protein
VLTTEGQGRAADPVGLGIPVVIEGTWAEPRIYPEIQGILDNPDAAYAKLKEMGKGLFGSGGGGPGGGSSDPLGGKLGETLGNLLQQGLGGLSQGGSSQGRSIPSPSAASPDPAPPLPPAAAQTETTPDSQAMNEVLRQLFNR